MRQYQALAWIGHTGTDLSPSQGSGRNLAAIWKLIFKIHEYYALSGLFLKGHNATEILPSQEGKGGSRDHERAKKIILTMQFSAGTSGFKICPLSTSKTPNYGKSRILWVTGTLWGLVCPCNCPAPSPSHCWAGDSWWSQSRAGTSTAHISPHTLSCSAVFPWTYLSSPSCCVLWRSKTRCPE